ncbi:MAG TPA: sialidase family protein [Verrucomicrobiae bacterium]|nr:sialidase family protein [Verrucomicrobiae bacterium]
MNFVSPSICSLIGASALAWLVADARAQVVGSNVNVSRMNTDQTEPAIAIDPTNPNRLFIASNLEGNGLFAAFSVNGGASWSYTSGDGRIADGNDTLPLACCEPSATCDLFGNLYLVYLKTSAPAGIVVLLSTNFGQGFRLLATLGSGHSVDQPTVAANCRISPSNRAVWVTYQDSSLAGYPVVAQGASVTGLGSVGAFRAAQAIPSSMDGNFGDIAVGPNGQVLVAYQTTGTGEGPSSIFVSLDPDGLGPAGFAQPVLVTTTGVGDYDTIPAEPERHIDANASLAYDVHPASPHFGRAYLAYTEESPDESHNTDILLRFSDNNGASWSAPVRINDDDTIRSQFLPRMAVDPTSGLLAASWYDCRNDDGLGGAGNRLPGANNDAQFYASVSFDGGEHWAPNVRVSPGTSTESASPNPKDFADYTALTFYNGTFHPVWADNSNSTGDNPDGATRMEIYTARVTVNAGSPLLVDAGTAVMAENCSPANGVVDPGERVTVNFSLQNVGRAMTTNLVATLLESGGVLSPGPSQVYGALPGGGAPVARPFMFTASGPCGGTVQASLRLQDGPSDLGVVSFPLPLGVMLDLSQSFANSTPIQITEQRAFAPFAASPYPSAITVTGVSDPINKVTVTLRNLSHSFVSDLDILLVGPGGQKTMLMSDAGGTGSVFGVTLTFDDAAPGIPDDGPLTSGVFGPRDYGGVPPDEFPAPAPAEPYPTALAAFKGVNPNGVWSLYVVDDLEDDEGVIAGGWSLDLFRSQVTCCSSSPRLVIARSGANVLIRWPAAATNYALEAKSSLNPAMTWSSVSSPVMTANGTNSVSVPISSGNRFFRLRQ